MHSDLNPLPRAVLISGHEGVAINVWDYGGRGPALLLCHCTGTLGRIWEPVAALLGGHFRVLAVDARGHGDSGQPAHRLDCAWEHSGHDLLAVIDGLGLGSGLWAAGHSGGAAHVAYAEYLRPGTFSRVALIDAIIGAREIFSGEAPLAHTARRRKDLFLDRESARARLGSKPPMCTWTPETLDAYVAHGLADLPGGMLTLKCPKEVEAWNYELGGACEVFEHFSELQFEALIITGERSELGFLAQAQRRRLSRGAFVEIAGAGHFIPQEMPQETARVLLEWFLEGTCQGMAAGGKEAANHSRT